MEESYGGVPERSTREVYQEEYQDSRRGNVSRFVSLARRHDDGVRHCCILIEISLWTWRDKAATTTANECTE